MTKLTGTVVLVLLLAASCVSEAPAPAVPSNQSPTAVVDSISPAEVYIGEKVTLTGHGIDPDGTVVAYKWYSNLDGDLGETASLEITSLSEGEHTINFVVQDDDGDWSSVAQARVVISRRPPVPDIEFFQAAPTRIGVGNSTVLSWYVSRATTVYLDHEIGNVPSEGNIEVSPVLSTEYILTATNDGGSATATTKIIVVPRKVGLPVVNSFGADPGNITTGNSTELIWDVSNADFVTVEPGVGMVDAVGSVSISPDTTTEYILTAYNTVGIIHTTTQVLVSERSAEGRPDLLITDIAKVETSEGVKIEYAIENRGTNDAPSSTVKLYANGVYMVLDEVAPVAAGSSVVKRLENYLYNPAANVVKLIADADSRVIESDENNNTMQVFFPVKTVYDFVENAPDAVWGDGYPYESLTFGESETEKGSIARYQTEQKIEDATGPGKFLETRPRMIVGGWIYGEYNIGVKVQPGYHLYSLVGLLQDAVAGDVKFWIYIRESGETEWTVVVPGVQDWYDGRIKAISVPIPAEYYNKNVDFSLRVNANGEPFQDWAVWVESKVIK